MTVDLDLWEMDSSNPEQFDAAWHHNQEVLDAMNLRDVQLEHNAQTEASVQYNHPTRIEYERNMEAIASIHNPATTGADEIPWPMNEVGVTMVSPASNADAENIPIAPEPVANVVALWVQVHDSTNIAGWHWSNGKLTVQFVTGTTYQYSDVPQAVAEAWLHADSFGVYFTTVIKQTGYKYIRI